MSKPFTQTISAEQLKRGLRVSKRSPRNTGFLVEAKSAVGRDGVLQAIEQLTRIDTSVITDAFPFPQIFNLTNFILVCGHKKIYEYNGSTLSLKYTATTVGGTWNVIDYFNYLYISNGKEVVIRSAQSGSYAINTTLPKAIGMCNYNGQAIIGAPDCGDLGASLMIPATAISTTMTIQGTYA